MLPGTVTSATFDNDNKLTQWTTSASSVTPSYDLDGSMVCDNYGSSCTGKTYAWDARNRLASIKSGSTNVQSAVYDGLNRRQSLTKGTSAAVSYLYDRANPVQEFQSGAVLANIMVGLGIDERFTRTVVATGTPSTFLPDGLGSTMALTDGAATPVIKTNYGYDPYGATTATGTANDNSYQFTGRENDNTAAGLYYYRARYYNPTWGRLISENPIGLRSGINRFAYVRGNPTGFIDPSGLFTVQIGFFGGYTTPFGFNFGGGVGLIVDVQGNVGYYITADMVQGQEPEPPLALTEGAPMD